ncbi:MAG: hypothetical protein IT169_16175 [Bryobacterales bacterium]|nr:hypothetical protein [Bryobacterales bacterium]
MQDWDRSTAPQPTVALPTSLDSLARFLHTASTLGTELAFWRSHARLEHLRRASKELQSLLLCPQVYEMTEPDRSAVLAAFEALLEPLAALKDAVPFRTKVGILRRSLVPCFQEIFILHQLTQAVVVRLRLRKQAGTAFAERPVGIVDPGERRSLQQSLSAAMPYWRKEEWNVYDCL